MNIYGAGDTQKIFNLTFDDLNENFLSGVILTKLNKGQDCESTEIELRLSDIFYFDFTQQPLEKYELLIPSKSGINLDIEKFASIMFKLDKPSEKLKKVSYEEFFGSWFDRTLRYLRDGDSSGTNPLIESFEKIGSDNTGTPTFKVRIKKHTFIENLKHNIMRQVYFGEETYPKVVKSLESSTPAITIDKQIGYLRELLDGRTEKNRRNTI